MPNYKGAQYRPSEDEKQELRVRYLSGETWNQLQAQFPGSGGALGNILRGLKKQRHTTTHTSKLETLSKISPIDVGWIAGIIDGEGYIGISRLRDGRYYQARVMVSSTTRPMQAKLKRLLGGHLGYRVNLRPNQRDTYTWSVWSLPTVRTLLTFVVPHLVVKRRAAQVVLRFCTRHINQKLQAATARDVQDYERVCRINTKGL